MQYFYHLECVVQLIEHWTQYRNPNRAHRFYFRICQENTLVWTVMDVPSACYLLRRGVYLKTLVYRKMSGIQVTMNARGE